MSRRRKNKRNQLPPPASPQPPAAAAERPPSQAGITAAPSAAPRDEVDPAETARGAESAVDATKLPVRLTSRHYVPLGVLLTIGLGIVTMTYAVTRQFFIVPLESQLTDVEKLRQAVDKDKVKLQDELTETLDRLGTLERDRSRPVLISPGDRASILGQNVTLRWTGDGRTKEPRFVLELRGSRDPSLGPGIVNVARPEAFREFADLQPGQYIWRILPGTVAGTEVMLTGDPSCSSVFDVYVSSLGRVRETHQILVASTPTSYDEAVSRSQTTGYRGFEIDLLKWLVEKLSSRLKLTISMRLVEIPWARIFDAMQQGEADIAVRSIACTSGREREYSNLRFSKPYFSYRQVLIARQPQGDSTPSLRDVRIGAKRNSQNALAAEALAKEYGSVVDDGFTAYGDLYAALDMGTIRFALVDEPLVAKYLNSRFYGYRGDYQEVLKRFYRANSGKDCEEYAVLVHHTSPKDSLLDHIDAILMEPDASAFLAELKRKYGLNQVVGP